MFLCVFISICFFFFKQKTAYEMRISDWSSDVCSSDLQGRDVGRAGGQSGATLDDGVHFLVWHAAVNIGGRAFVLHAVDGIRHAIQRIQRQGVQHTVAAVGDRRWIDGAMPKGAAYGQEDKIGRASCRERGGQYV